MTPMCLERDGLSLIEWAPLRGLANKKAHRTVPSVTVLKKADQKSPTFLPDTLLILNWQYVGEKKCIRDVCCTVDITTTKLFPNFSTICGELC